MWLDLGFFLCQSFTSLSSYFFSLLLFPTFFDTLFPTLVLSFSQSLHSFCRNRKRPTFISAFQTNSTLLTSWSALNGSTLITQLIWPIGLSPSPLPDVSTLVKLIENAKVVVGSAKILTVLSRWFHHHHQYRHCMQRGTQHWKVFHHSICLCIILLFLSLALLFVLLHRDWKQFSRQYLPWPTYYNTEAQAGPFQCGSVPVFVNLLVRRVYHLIEFDRMIEKRRNKRMEKTIN